MSNFRPEVKEGKEVETEKKAEQDNNESDKIEKELEKDKVRETSMKRITDLYWSLMFTFLYVRNI